jgi:hypothetical protein
MKNLEYRYTIGDTSWTLDFFALTVDDYIAVKKVTGYRPGQFAVEVDAMDALALKAALWLARRKSGEDIAWSDPAMSFVVSALKVEVVADDTTPDTTPEAKAGQGADPTKAPRAPRTRTARKTSATK